MSIVRYRPLSVLDQLNSEMNNLFGRNLWFDDAEAAAGSIMPPVDIKEDDKAYTLHAELAGVDPKDIDISMHDGTLTIKGEKKSKSETKEEGYTRVETVSGHFSRSFRLPDAIEDDGIKASTKHGVIAVTIPKRKEASPRSIQIDVEDK
jgi:HSP20 family protein